MYPLSYTHAHQEKEDLIYDRVIVCTGWRFDASIFDESCKPKLTINNRFPEQTSEWESTNIKDLYFAGVLMHMRDFKKKQSGFIHGFRHNIRALHHILEQKYQNNNLPSQTIRLTPEKIVDAIIKRVNVSAGLWQQTGFLCDAIVISNKNQYAQYYQEFPTDYVHDSELGKNNHYYTISLEFGLDIFKANKNPFAIERIHKQDIEAASESAFIHPIIRRFSQGKLVAEHHIIEDLTSEWSEDIHIQPLLEFFYSQLINDSKSMLEQIIPALPKSEKITQALVK